MVAPSEGGVEAVDVRGPTNAPFEARPEDIREGVGPSRRLLNTAGRIATAAIAQSTGEDAQILGFTPRDFVIFGLPYRNPKTSPYVRRNGALTFTITGGTHGIPYGQDRLLAIWLATVF